MKNNLRLCSYFVFKVYIKQHISGNMITDTNLSDVLTLITLHIAQTQFVDSLRTSGNVGNSSENLLGSDLYNSCKEN